MKKNKGITLISLIITIIVMLILVAVSVNILIKSNLIGNAEKATNAYKTATEEEMNGGKIKIGDTEYDSIDDYVNRNNLQLKYKAGNGKIRVYLKNSAYDYINEVDKDKYFTKNVGMTFDDWVTNYLKANEITQEKLAEMLDVSVAYISRVECGSTEINMKRLAEICGLLDVSLSYVLEDISPTSSAYLNTAFTDLLKNCPPEKIDLIYKIAKIIVEN